MWVWYGGGGGGVALPCHSTSSSAPSGIASRSFIRTHSQEGITTTLDGLRSGDVGETIPRASVQATSLFTNAFLP